MLYGDDPREGYVRGQRFVHPDLRFAFKVPDGFQMTNSPTAVTARHSSGAQVKFDSASRTNAANVVEYLTKVWARDARLSQIETIEVNGIPTATGVTRVKGKDVRLVAYDAGDKSTIYRFLIATPPGETDRLEPGIRAMVMSFTRLNAQQAAEATPLRIDVHKVRRGDSVASLAARSDFGNAAEKRFRVLNGLEDGEQVQPSQMVKLVVE